MNDQGIRSMATAAEVAQHYRVSRFSILRAYRQGLIPAVKIGRLVRFDLWRVQEALETARAVATCHGDAHTDESAAQNV